MARLLLPVAAVLSILSIVVLAHPFGAVRDTGAASAAAARRLAPLVKERFKLFVSVAHCGFADNQYAFNLALGKFRGTDRETLRKAAYEGWAAGDAADAGPCAAAIGRLAVADDELLAQAELVP